MAGFLDKTVDSINAFLSPVGTSASLKNLFKQILSARTKREEEHIIRECLKTVRERLSDSSSSSSTISRCLTFATFACMLGYDSSFAHVHALNFAQHSSPVEKKIGYLACCFLLCEKNPLSILVTNTIVKDISGNNILAISNALSACCQLITAEHAGTVLPLVAERLSYSNGFVRRKAVIAMHYFYNMCPLLCSEFIKRVTIMLGDKDPAVVTHVLQFLISHCKMTGVDVEEFVPSLLHIAQQILEGNVPTSMIYRGLPAPWMQIYILRLFSLLTKPSSDAILIVRRMLDSSKDHSRTIIGAALVQQCILTLIHLNPDGDVPALATSVVGQFLSQDDINMKFEGLSLLEDVLTHFSIAFTSEQRQNMLMGMSHPDHSFRRKTLELLCAIAREGDAESVSTLVVDYIRQHCMSDSHLKTHFINKVVNLTEKFSSSSNHWHVATLLRLLTLSDDKQAQMIKTRIKTSLVEDTDTIKSTRQKVIKFLSKCVESKSSSTSVLELYAWVLCRFYQGGDTEDVPLQLVKLGQKVLSNSSSELPLSEDIQGLLVEIILSLEHVCETRGTAAAHVVKGFVEDVLDKSLGNGHLRYCCIELLKMLPRMDDIFKTLTDSSVKESKMDFTLSFLDSVVVDSLKAGGPVYVPKTLTINVVSELKDLPRPSSANSDFLSSLGGSWKHLSVDTQSNASVESSGSKPWTFTSLDTSDLNAPNVWTASGRATEPNVTETNTSSSTILNLPSELLPGSEDPFDRLLEDEFPGTLGDGK